MPIKRTWPGAGCKNRGREEGRQERKGGVLERDRGEFGDEFVMIFKRSDLNLCHN